MSLRTTFDREAELYDRARPGYPVEVFDVLDELLPGNRLLEIGCGTGQATRVLLERGYSVTCVELGANLADLARQRAPDAHVILADFDTWDGTPSSFDGVLAFTSFHWLDPHTRFPRIATLLGPEGVLAVVGTSHVLPPDGDPFFREVQADYDAVVPDERSGAPLSPDAVEPFSFDEELFGRVVRHRYVWDLEYTADKYVAVLATYSGHIALRDEQREELFARIRTRIARQGTIRKTYLTTLDAAIALPQRRP
jgi:SAM-dependent methyltransferase